MAEEHIEAPHEVSDPNLSRDDVSALNFVLQHVKGSSPSSMSLATVEDSEA